MLEYVNKYFGGIDSSFGYYLKTLGGGRIRVLLRRLPRLRRLAKSIVLNDPKPPFPIRLQIETTDICNLKCIMCTRKILDDLDKHSIGIDEFVKTVETIEPYYVTLNGLGEPLIDRTIFEKLSYLRRKGIMTSMPTNGTCVSKEKLDRLALNLPDILQLSIDGASKETFEEIRILSDFHDIINTFRTICERRAEGKSRRGTIIGVECTLQRRNMFEFKEMFELFSSLPKDNSFGLVPVFNYDPNGDAFVDVVPSREEVMELHRRLDESMTRDIASNEHAFYKKWRAVSTHWLEESDGCVTEPEENHHLCIVPWFNAYIDAKGRVYPCCFLTATEHIMGNIYEEPFADIWSGIRFREFRIRISKDRANLQGCRTCPRKDDARMRQLNMLRPLLGANSSTKHTPQY